MCERLQRLVLGHNHAQDVLQRVGAIALREDLLLEEWHRCGIGAEDAHLILQSHSLQALLVQRSL